MLAVIIVVVVVIVIVNGCGRLTRVANMKLLLLPVVLAS